MDDKVQHIGIRPRPQDEQGKMLHLVDRPIGCIDHAYLIDPKSHIVTCTVCKQSFDPLVVLVDLCRKESRWMQNLADYEDRMKRLAERRRTTCEHCKQMTRIKGE